VISIKYQPKQLHKPKCKPWKGSLQNRLQKSDEKKAENLKKGDQRSLNQGHRVLQHSVKNCRGALIIYQFSDMAYRGVLIFPETQNRAKKCKKTHPEFTELGEIASEDGRKVMDHKK
jgi:hypothetical protein